MMKHSPSLSSGESSMVASKRFHSFDAFRAVLAMAGVLLHAYYFYLIFNVGSGSFNQAFLGMQSKGSYFFTLLAFWIHSFRMPAFFALSGFFSVYLLEKIGKNGALRNRCQRIAIPFLVLWLVPLLYIAAKLVWIHANPVEFYHYLNLQVFTYVGTFWFLYFLIIFDAILFLIFVPIFKSKFSLISFVDGRLFSAVSLGLILSSILCLIFLGKWFVPTSASLLPNSGVLIYYGLFFAFGCLFSKQYSKYPRRYQRYWPWGLVASIVLTGVYWILFSSYHAFYSEKLVAESIVGLLPWLMMATLFFLFERIASKPNKIWRYLADSSYWIYIAQMPILAVLSVLFFDEKWSVLIAVPLMTLITLGLLLLSYQLLIRKRRHLNYIDGARSQ